MLKIGEFSRLCQVTVKTLHHYDELGLLKPAQIDPFTNYRFYSLDQLPRIHRIMVLKEMGLSLEQIAEMIDRDLPTEQLRGMLLLKEAEVQQQVAVEQARLARIRFHIRQIDMEATMSQLDIRIKEIAPLRALTIRFQAKDHRDIDRVGGEMQDALKQHGIHPVLNPVRDGSQPVQIVYAAEYHQHDIDVEFAIPVDATWQGDLPLATAGTMTVREIAGVPQAASYIYEGNPDNINENLVNVQRWVAANGYKLCDSVRFVALQGPFHDRDFDNWMLEIQYPLEKA